MIEELTVKTKSELLNEVDRLCRTSAYQEAELLCRELFLKDPLDCLIHNALATVLDLQGRYPEAVAHYNKALLLNTQFVLARYNLANTLRRAGDDKGALETLRSVVRDKPEFIEAWKSLAMLHISKDAYTEAAVCFEKIVALAPSDVESHCALGNMYAEAGYLNKAVACFEALLAMAPDHVLTLESLGTVLHELDDLDYAEGCFRRVLELEPERITVLNNLGTVLRSQTRLDEAIKLFDHALCLSPENGQILFNRSVARLAKGELIQGWQDYEARFDTRNPTRLVHADFPRWNGEPLNGRTILVQSEQGFGDTFQFVRYLPLVANMGGHVVLECQNRSVQRAITGIDHITVISRGDELPHIDFQIPLASLPPLFQTDMSNIPAPQGYLRPSLQLVHSWSARFDRSYMNVGLVWGGNKYSLNANRSLQLSILAELFTIPGVRWHSLQLGPDAEQLADFPQIADLGKDIDTFGDTAAIITNLDLVVTIDSAVAHLSGALGAPVWIMLKHSPDWRWFLNRDDSPWYSSARLFRQQATGDWSSVARAVSSELKKMCSA